MGRAEPRIHSVCLFCGSSSGRDPEFARTAAELANRLAVDGITLVTGGGGVGLMGAAADAALAAGGRVIGIIPERLMRRELAHKALSELHVVHSMHERKAKMAELSDAFVAAPGGIGTLEELFEVFTWKQLGYHDKPVIVLNVNGYYDPLLDFLRHAVTAGLVQPGVLAKLLVCTSAAEAAAYLAAAEAPRLDFRANEDAT